MPATAACSDAIARILWLAAGIPVRTRFVQLLVRDRDQVSDSLTFFLPLSLSKNTFACACARAPPARHPGRSGHVIPLTPPTCLLVRECHRRGIEVILDIVFNHTAEGNEQGPTLSMRGLDNRIYYMLAPGGEYYNYSGCGNVVNCNHPVVRQFIVDCLKYWVEEYHVDGFRCRLGRGAKRLEKTAWMGSDLCVWCGVRVGTALTGSGEGKSGRTTTWTGSDP
eukprot:364007-Chlamydomonas_euryale.AAC.2